MDSKNNGLTRSVSFPHQDPEALNATDCDSLKFKTIAASARSIKRKRSTWRRRTVQTEGEPEKSTKTLVDDIICLDSFEDLSIDGSLPIIVSKELIRQNIIELSRTSGLKLDLSKIDDIDDVTSFFKESSAFDRNVALLMAALLSKVEVVKYLIVEKSVDLEFYEPRMGLNALHISAFVGSLDIVQLLIKQGAAINVIHTTYSPLHCSVLSDQRQVAEFLLSADSDVNRVGFNGESPLHTAVRARACDCIQLLLNHQANLNAQDSAGYTPLHIAADSEDATVAKVLVETGLCDMERTTRYDRNTPLHLAAQNGSVNVLRVLLNAGANLNAQNARMKTSLHFASRSCIECTRELLTRGANPNTLDLDNRTPLHTAVSRSELCAGPEITSLLISWRADVNCKDRYGYTPLHIAALNELPDCVDCLIRHGADVTARTRGGAAALAIIARKTPTALSALYHALDGCITSSDPYREITLKFNFRYLLQGCERGEMSFVQTLVDEGQREILEHPLCQAFLHLKWQKIKRYYAARLVFCFLFVVLLSIYVLTALAYQCYNESQPESRIIVFDPNMCTSKSYFGNWLRQHPGVIETVWFLLVSVTLLEIARKMYGFSGYKNVRTYMTVGNLVEWFVIIAVFATSFVFTGSTHIWQNHVGAFAVLFGWANLMIMIGHLPTFGSYVAMYTRVQREFAKLLSAYICLLIGFTISLCVIFPKTQEFANPFVGFIKILVMMVGELDFSDLLNNIKEEPTVSAILLEISALATFVLFLLFVTVILINLLIGIAVHDIQGLQKTAGLSKLVGLTNLMTHIETALFGNRLPDFFLRLLNVTALISPSTYRVVVSVKPLNPRETRLPRDIMRAALDIAKQSKEIKRTPTKMRSTWTFRRKTFENASLRLPNDSQMQQLTEEILELKTLVNYLVEKIDNQRSS